MSVRAKFRVDSIKKYPQYDKSKGAIYEVEMRPVNGDTEENKRFYSSTPSGEIKIAGVSAEVGAQWELGEEYYVDFTKAEQA
jgi:hypothetical protein